jgi:hypothetical protein
MAHPDPQDDNVRDRRGERWHRLLGIATVGVMGGAVTMWIQELGTGQASLVQSLSDRAFMTSALLVVVWVILWAYLRLSSHLRQLGADRYRDGYAAGYVDAAVKAREDPQDRPSLHPVN